jgi:hypothetical protein
MEQSGPSGLLHIVNGHSLSKRLPGVLPGRFLVYADCLHDGPVPAFLSGEELRRVRAQWLAGADPSRFGEILESLREVDRELDGSAAREEVVLWYEHDLFDQLLLIRLLEHLSRLAPGATRLSLVSIDSHPGVEHFKGMGQLTTAQLVALWEERRPVGPSQIELAVRAWQAFRADTPAALEQLLGGDASALPFLASALRRLLEEYPSVTSGLPRSEREILRCLSSRPLPLEQLFAAVHAGERSYFLADLSFRDRLRDLASGAAPLIELRDAALESDLPLSHGTASLTRHGSRVLAGEADWLADGAFNRWIGGVHLHRGSMWRRDESAGTIRRA